MTVKTSRPPHLQTAGQAKFVSCCVLFVCPELSCLVLSCLFVSCFSCLVLVLVLSRLWVRVFEFTSGLKI
jgi:hypothetical protein